MMMVQIHHTILHNNLDGFFSLIIWVQNHSKLPLMKKRPVIIF
jgi:hypothetical protein